MAFKQFQIAQIGPVTVYKRRGTRSVRLTVTADGTVKISQPTWLPYKTGLDYAASKQTWLAGQLAARSRPLLAHGQAVGKSHRLFFEAYDGGKPTSRITSDYVLVRFPLDSSVAAPAVQAAAERACVRALRQEAEEFIPVRLRGLAEQHNFRFKSVQIKLLKSRWGSCDSKKAIVVNLFAMQLPDRLIDYILLHELTHTEQLNHGEGFWRRLTSALPEAKKLRKELRQHQPRIQV